MKKIVLFTMSLVILVSVSISVFQYTVISKTSKSSIDETVYSEAELFVVNSEIKENFDQMRKYTSSFDFPYDNIEFATGDVYKTLKDAYEQVDFYGEFKKGDMELYNEYRKKYIQLINNEVPFLDSHTGEVYYLNEFEQLKIHYENDTYDINNLIFHFLIWMRTEHQNFA